eukprot:s278_g51.t1
MACCERKALKCQLTPSEIIDGGPLSELPSIGKSLGGFLHFEWSTELEDKVALKKIEGVFEHITIAKRTLRELRILRHLQHENLMQVKNIFMVGSRESFKVSKIKRSKGRVDILGGANFRGCITAIPAFKKLD